MNLDLSEGGMEWELQAWNENVGRVWGSNVSAKFFLPSKN